MWCTKNGKLAPKRSAVVIEATASWWAAPEQGIVAPGVANDCEKE